MKKQRKVWMLSRPPVPEPEKAQLQSLADQLVESVLKPAHIKPPPVDNDFNYLSNIYTKWFKNCFYFCSTYQCPSPNAISPSFEASFARLESICGQRYKLAYMRHTGAWHELYTNLSMEEALKAIRDEPHFMP